MRAVGHDTSTIAPDLIGLGRSEFDANRVDLPNQALAVLRLLDEWDIGRVVVAGHDLGGSVALHLATLAPDRVAGLVSWTLPCTPTSGRCPPSCPCSHPASAAPTSAASGECRLLRASSVRGCGQLPDEDVAAYLAPLLTREGAAGLLAVTRRVDLTGEAALGPRSGSPAPGARALGNPRRRAVAGVRPSRRR